MPTIGIDFTVPRTNVDPMVEAYFSIAGATAAV